MPVSPQRASERQTRLAEVFLMLIDEPAHPLGNSLNPDEVPTDRGLYAISLKNAGPGEYVHAGLAKAGGPRRRIWD